MRTMEEDPSQHKQPVTVKSSVRYKKQKTKASRLFKIAEEHNKLSGSDADLGY